MKKIIIIIIVFVCYSCDDRILDISSQDQVSSAQVWKDPNLIENYVNGRYNELPHGFIKWAGGLKFSAITDESFFPGQAHILNKFIKGGLTADGNDMHFYGSLWLDAYKGIYNCSLFEENLIDDVGDPERIKQLVAEVKFLRAWFYVELISRYGPVPLIKETFTLEDDLTLDRASVEEVVAYIVEELNLAILDLPENQIGGDFGKVTKPAAIALKVRALMYLASPLFIGTANPHEKWGAVATACEELFLYRNTLSEDYKGLFLNPSDPEVLFFKQFISDVVSDFNTSNVIDLMRYPSGFGGKLNEEGEHVNQYFIDSYETIDGEIPVKRYTGSTANLQPVLNALAISYDPQNPYKNRDPRLKYSVLYDGTTFSGRALEFWEGGKDSRGGIDPGGSTTTGYGIRKSLDEGWTKESGASSEQPWVYMRLSEFFLTYAEAQYHLGFTAVAEEYVDKVRSRVGVEMPPIATSLVGMDLLDKIKHERKIELAFEGNRWYDSRRWGDVVANFSQNIVGVKIEKDNVTEAKSYVYFVQDQRGNFPEHQQLFPIPASEMTKICWRWDQNPGYFQGSCN